jgi:hypothetical protein
MDKRKNNGGNSTKAKGFDKRKNPYKDVVNDVITAEELEKILKMLLGKAINEEDISASKLLLEYSLGKPKETKDIKMNVNKNFPEWLDE